MRFKIDELLWEAKQKGNKVTQTQLARAAMVGNTAINKIIHNETNAPDPAILLTIADVLSEALGRQITINDLIETNSDKPAPAPEPPQEVQAKHTPPASKMTIEVISAAPREDFILVPMFRHIPGGDLRRVREEDIMGYLPLPKKLWEG